MSEETTQQTTDYIIKHLREIEQRFTLPRNYRLASRIELWNTALIDWKDNDYKKLKDYIQEIEEIVKNPKMKFTTSDSKKIPKFNDWKNILDNSNNYYEFLFNYYEFYQKNDTTNYYLMIDVNQDIVCNMIDIDNLLEKTC